MEVKMENVQKKITANGISKGFAIQCNGCQRSALVAGVFGGHPKLWRQPRDGYLHLPGWRMMTQPTCRGLAGAW